MSDASNNSRWIGMRKKAMSVGLAAILVLSSIVIALPVQNAYAAVNIETSTNRFYGPGFVRVVITDTALTTSGATIIPTIQAIRGNTVLGQVQPTIYAIGTSGQFEFFITTSNDNLPGNKLTPRSPTHNVDPDDGGGGGSLQQGPFVININASPLDVPHICGCVNVEGGSGSTDVPPAINAYGLSAVLKDGDKIKIIYGDKEATIDFASTVATLEVDRTLAGDENAIILRLRDRDANLDPTIVDTFTSPSGQLTPSVTGTVTWRETGANTGIFEATIYVDGPASTPPTPNISVTSLPSTVEFKIRDFKIYEAVTGATDGSAAGGDNFTTTVSTVNEDSKTVTIRNSDGKITLLKDITFANGVQVEIEDPDANVSTEDRETITVTVSVGANSSSITFKETGNNTNKFVPDLSQNRIPIEVGGSTSVASNKITLTTADIANDVDIEIKYNDTKVDTATGGPPKDFKVVSKLKHVAGTLTSVQDKVPINGKFALRLVDPDLDTGAGQQSYTVDSNGDINNAAGVKVGELKIVAKGTTLSSIPSGLNIVFIEDPDTPGTFVASNLSMSAINSAVTGGLSDGDLVEIKYKDIMEATQPTSTARITIGKPSISIEVDRSSVPIPTSSSPVKFKVKIIDPLANDNPGSTETIATSNSSINATHPTLSNLKVKYELIDVNNNVIRDNDASTTGILDITSHITGANVTFTETGASTGEFEATYTLTLAGATTASALNNLKLKITYISGSDSVSTSVTFRAFDGSLTTDKSEVRNGTELTITVVDQDGNRDPENAEKLNVTLQGKSDDLTAVSITLDETGPNTGTFSKKITVGKDVKITDLSTNKFSTRLSIKYTDALASDLTTNVDREQEIRVRTATGNIIVQPEVIGPATKVIIIVDDPDLNANPDGTDTINGSSTNEYLRITSDRSGTTANIDADGKEIGPNEGKFKTVLKLSPLSSANASGSFTGTGDEIEGRVLPGDIVSIRYTDEKDENGNKRVISVTFQVKSFDGEIIAPDSVKPGDSFTVKIIDADANRDPDTQDSIRLKVTSTTDPVGLEVTALETSANSGEFAVSVSTTTGVSAGSLSVKEGDSITIRYTDQYPSDYADRVKQVVDPSRDILFTMQVGVSLAPTERTTVAEPSLRDQAGNVLTQASVDVPVSIASSIKNNTQQAQKFVYIVQVKDADGFVVSISTVGGTLAPGQSFDVSASWTPTAAGTYTIEIFVWNELGKPSPLSKVESATVRAV